MLKLGEETEISMLTYGELIKKVKNYSPEVDYELIKKAYLFALEQHGTQVRESGELYFSHPLAVAEILAGLKMDQVTIISGLLHDIVEDTPVTVAQIEELFGSEISKIVDGVTKISNIECTKIARKQAENYKKLLIAAASDIRVLIIKLADRLHNMRTLRFKKSKSKREAIARETIEIYAPLAESIGLNQIKDELQDIAFYELYPELYNSIRDRLKDLYNSENEIVDTIGKKLAETLDTLGFPYKIDGRLKTPYSIWNKMNVRTMSFDQLSDIMAFRIIVEDEKQCYRVLGLIHSTYLIVPRRFRDYISSPKSNGYQSLHTCVIGPLNKRIEIQIRTNEMHLKSEYGIAAHWEYKEHKNTKGRGVSSYQWLKNMVRILDNSQKMDDFLKYSKTEIVSENVFGITPKGEIISLPVGSSVLDFAYAIHTEIGNHAIGATINNKEVPLKTIIENGNQINIITDRTATPHGVWQTYVTTTKAKTEIRRALMSFETDNTEITGKACFDELLENNNVTLSEPDFRILIKNLGYDTKNQFFFAIGSSALTIPDIANKYKELFNHELSLKLRTQCDNKYSEMIIGLPDLPIIKTFCCSPILGDKLFGTVITKDNDSSFVEIHIEECERLKKLLCDIDVQVYELYWNTGFDYKNTYFTVRISLVVLNHVGNLSKIAKIIEQKEVSILSLRIGETFDNFKELFLELKVSSLAQLKVLLAILASTPFVQQVTRK